MKARVTASSPPRTPASSFRLRLQEELAQRCERNPRYSLRSFALHLGSDHSTLSQILRGRRPLTPASIGRLGSRLGLSADEIEAYAANERLVASDPPALHREVRRLAHDAASVIADGCNGAILELVRLKGFRTDARWIARVLGISVDEVNLALSRLTRLGLLEMAEPDRWIDRSGDTVASEEGFPRAVLERLWERIGRLPADAVGSAPASLRDHSGTTLAVRTDRLPEAIERIARFRRELIEFLGRGDDLDDVYHLEIGLFPVTHLNRRKE